MAVFLRFLFAMIFLAVVGKTYAQAAEEEELTADAENEEDPKEILRLMDKNGDGKLTFQEIFDEVMGSEDGEGEEQASEREEFRAKLQKHFTASDSNGDEALDEDELKKLVMALENDEEEL
mmetsp:Transcript_26732/g.67245  ORF Transcript_26732/g.67245 Transcript_26732/m.67245 type:complete len:121 (+) Transcript_26732:92-454(+)|eukprot:CAMPEP_0115275622 /NCGR_PEP_ID=MMETSP0270-20121206/56293_1 /TAXON_ID=71861 /ORGANISM="Scrippsiella trochoidea, Strain CCMP3099" /LENGTH=120 /DNA_ID=CAMNT_0002692185 /DNA_START=71 /DNA_END=433 /DNA_ORIENTATION=-